MYDVFLSFRGEDTRTTFTSHLFTALGQKSINTFIDYQLRRGVDVWPALEIAIEKSRVAIVVFSENYVTSKWCLEELVKILECREKHGQVVIPVFYNIAPTEIRNQRGSFERALAKHERDLRNDETAHEKLLERRDALRKVADLSGWSSEINIGKHELANTSYERAFAKHERDLRNDETFKNKVPKWKAALTEAANISGWSCESHMNESHIIEKIVNDVNEKLYLINPKELTGDVITEENYATAELLFKKSRVIGIWGMGGIGKTIIAKRLFVKHFPQYDKVCFVANAKDYSLDKLLRELFKEETSTSIGIGSTSELSKLFNGKKVFIVLDNANMNCDDQVEYLCTQYRNLSPDSKLIITTREKQLLNSRVDRIHEVKKWKRPDSFNFFCKKAFENNLLPKDYEVLANTAVDYAGDVPLALQVLGSHLRDKSIEFWGSTLKKLENLPNEKIQSVLKESIDGLDKWQHKIFLDIAFFFKGENKDRVKRILNACDFEASSGIEDLEDKTLITISNNKTIQMHDLIQQVGFEEVREQCKGGTGRHSRLRGIEAHDVLGENKGTAEVEGIILDLSQIKDIQLSPDTFKKMSNLRLIKFFVSLGQSPGKINLPPKLEPFSNKLRYFEWNGYPSAYLPHPFHAKLLVEICMPHSHVEKLWQGTQDLHNLEGINLSECKQLKELPDLSKALRLNWVNLTGCESLSHLHSSVLSAKTLVTLILDRCTKLERVAAETHLKYLQKISVNGCSNLKYFAVSSDVMENLDLSNTGIQTIDPSIGLLTILRWFSLEGLRLKHLPKELSCLTSLAELKISKSGMVIDKQQLHVLFDGLKSLRILHLKYCSNLYELADNIEVLKQLQELRLDGSSVKSLPTNIKHLEKLEILSLENCKELLCLPELPQSIRQLNAINCLSLESVSNLKKFATKMMGKTKLISFQNSFKLDENSLDRMMDSLHLTMLSASFHNKLVRNQGAEADSYNYNSVEACFPGRRVPRQFIHQKTTMSSITITLPRHSNMSGFIYSVVLSPSSGVNESGALIQCQCLLEDGTKMSSWQNKSTIKLNSDHVYVWYDPFHCDTILGTTDVSFEFRLITTDAGEVDGSVSIKECAVQLITDSELYNVLPKLNLASDRKKGLEHSVERSDEKESNIRNDQIQNQQQDFSVTESKSVVAVPESSVEVTGRKAHSSDVEESIESAQEQDKAGAGKGRKVNNTDSTQVVKSKGNEGMPTESGAGLHLPVNSVNKENVFMDKSSENDSDRPDNIEEGRHLEEHNLQGQQIIVHSDPHDLTVEEPCQGIENQQGEQESDEDPFAEVDSILLENQNSSPKTSSSTSDFTIGEALRNLESLLEKSLENIVSDIQLQQQLHILLNCIGQTSEENVSPSIRKLVKRMSSSVDEIFKNFGLNQREVKDHTSHLQQKEIFMQQICDAKKRLKFLREETSQMKSETASLEKEADELDEKIQLLLEQKETVQLKQAHLKEALEICDGEKKELKDEAKNWVAPSKELMLVINNSKSSYGDALSKQEKLNDKWESFKTTFAGNSKTFSS